MKSNLATLEQAKDLPKEKLSCWLTALEVPKSDCDLSTSAIFVNKEFTAM